MTRHIYLALAFHNHQPVGNFEWVFEKGYSDAYLPMVAALERHPAVRAALHYSGPLRDWLAAQRPEFLDRVAALVERGQVEMMGGAYYEPVLVALPDVDKAGQTAKLTEAVIEDFGYHPTGFWLAERVWEPHLAKPLAQANMAYTIVDDTHFKCVGLEDEDLLGYYVTEEQGYPLRIFATSKHLRYVIPWGSVTEVVDWLHAQADDGGQKVAVMGDDGEKFGLWPGTHAHCWTEGWIEEFFQAVESNAEWLTPIPPGEYANQFASLGRVYLPTASYDEMGEWSLPASLSHQIVHVKHELEQQGREDILRFVRGGFWRFFQVKYNQVNTMHTKMLRVSEKVHAMTPGALKREALNEVWQGQCNCPYWHGVFGGIYLFHIRAANFDHLIRGEMLADRLRHSEANWVEWEAVDLDKDGQQELLLASDTQTVCVDPTLGGALFEWDWRGKAYNLLNTMTRQREGYHQQLTEAVDEGRVVLTSEVQELESIHTSLVRVKEEGLADKLLYDWYRRGSFIDHLFPAWTTLDAFYRCQYPELGDFVNQPYKYDVAELPDGLRVSLAREGHVWQGGTHAPLRVEKQLTLSAGSTDLDVSYTITNLGDGPVVARFGVETNWGILGGDGEGAYYEAGQQLFPLDSMGDLGGVARLSLVSRPLGMGIAIAFSHDATLWRFPIETVSNSEAGFERSYQGSCLLAHWPLEVAPGESWSIDLRFTLAES